MRTLLLALGIALSLSACETGAKGPPPAFSPNIQALFEQYMREKSPTLFVVSTDGQYANYTYCPGYADHCSGLGGATKATVLRKCEKESGGVPCEVYAVGRRIVWKGTAASGQVAGSTSVSDYEICNWAITIKDGTPFWDGRIKWQKAVSEARRRDLTPEQCVEILGKT